MKSEINTNTDNNRMGKEGSLGENCNSVDKRAENTNNKTQLDTHSNEENHNSKRSWIRF